MSTTTVPHSRHARLERFLPFLSWFPMVNKRTFSADVTAGITGALVVLPQGVAFATIAGMPPEYGLYAGMIPAIIAALFGSSWHLVSGPTTAASIVLFSSLSTLAEPASPEYVKLALTLAFMVGVIELALGLLKLGALVNFISHSVVIGFTAGAGILIAANQIKNFLGFEPGIIPRGSHFYEVVWLTANNLSHIHWQTALVGVITLASGILIRKYVKVVPFMIGAILLGSAASILMNVTMDAGIATVGALPASFPPLSAPSFDPSVWRQLATTAFAMTMFALTEALSISRALAVKSGQNINGDQEFIGQGLSNIVGSFFSGYVATGSFNRSGLNYQSGAQTPIAAIIAGGMLMLAVPFIAPYAIYMPNAAMAGVLFLVAYGLIDWHHIRQIIRSSKSETVVLSVTFFSTLFLDLELAIFAGVILSLLLYLNRTSHPQIHVRVPDPMSANRKFTTDPNLPECDQLRIIRMDGSLFFGAVATFRETMRNYEIENPNRKHLCMVMSGVNFVDIAGAEALAETARRFRDRGGCFYLIYPKPQVMERLRKGGQIDDIGEENIFRSKTDALRTIYRRFDYERCKDCAAKGVFVECARMGKQEPTGDEDDEEFMAMVPEPHA